MDSARSDDVESMPLAELAEQVLVRAWGRGGKADAYELERGELALDAIDAGDVRTRLGS